MKEKFTVDYIRKNIDKHWNTENLKNHMEKKTLDK